jgi:glyoxylase-like metal-dependent hydrolase (beta-lactamase superfamily II)
VPDALIDLRHLGRPRVCGVYLLEGSDGPALVDCGPASCLDELRAGLERHGLAVSDLRHLLLTHIHLDHGGAAGQLVRENPDLQVHVSPVGAPHVVNPARLQASARRLYGDDLERLWGPLLPVPEENVRIADGKAAGLEVLATPGHARHQVTYVDERGRAFPGDTLGVRIVPSPHIRPHAPPPDIDVEGWLHSIDQVGQRGPGEICLPHFGVVADVDAHLEELRRQLRLWVKRVGAGWTPEQFVAAAEEELLAGSDAETAPGYRSAAAAGASYLGLERYWRKRRERA